MNVERSMTSAGVEGHRICWLHHCFLKSGLIREAGHDIFGFFVRCSGLRPQALSCKSVIFFCTLWSMLTRFVAFNLSRRIIAGKRILSWRNSKGHEDDKLIC
jgi:hypothetical protein